MTVTDQSPVHGTVDREGRLVAADPRLLALQLSAGGEAGGMLAVPQLASLARLARSLGVMVSRNVMAADGDSDLDLLVRARPDGALVQLAIGGWEQRQSRAIAPEVAAARVRAVAQLGNEGRWQTDATLRLTLTEGLDDVLAGQTLVGARLTRVFKLVDDDEGNLPILEAIAERLPFAGQIAELREVAGARLSLHGQPLETPDGRFLGYSGGFRWLERRFATPAAAPAVAISRFAERLDGALRRPLGQIISSADSISTRSDGPLRQDYASYASDIASAGRHLLGLVDDLADVQAVERSDFIVATEPVDLCDIARRAAGLLAVRAADRDVRIDVSDAQEPLFAHSEFRRALQILVNLVGNAVRYSPKGSAVWIRTEREGDLAALVVADQGKGIALADQTRIFEKFERVDPNEPGGNGLGLYISRRLARAMGGDITVDSAPGQGARFVLTLPAVNPVSAG